MGKWDDASNWSSNPSLPTSEDNVKISDILSTAPQVRIDNKVKASAYNLEVIDAELSNHGTLEVGGDMSSHGLSNWHNGIINVTGDLSGISLSNSGTLNVGGNLSNSHVLHNEGTLTVEGNVINSKYLTNYASGVLSTKGITGNGNLYFYGGTIKALSDNAEFISSATTITLDDNWESGEAVDPKIDSNGYNIGIGANIGGSGGLTKTGAGTLTLSGANSYSGGTTVSGGLLSIGSDSNIGNGTNTLNGGGLLLAEATYSKDWVLGTNGGTISNGSAATMNGVLSGSGGLTKTGTGTLTLIKTNTYEGGTTVSAGTLQAGAEDIISTSSGLEVQSGAVFDLNNYNQTVKGLSGAGDVYLGTAVLTASGNNENTTFSGVISGFGSLTKVGDGTLTLLGNNCYTGGTVINAGTMVAGNSNALGTGDVSLTAGTLDIGTTKLDVGAFSANSDTTIKVSAESLSKYGTLTYASALSGNNGTVEVSLVGIFNDGDELDVMKSNTGDLGYNAANTILSSRRYGFTTDADALNEGILRLVLSREESLADDVAGDPNLEGIANVLEEIRSSGASGDMLDVLNQLDGMTAEETKKAIKTFMPDVSSGSAKGSRMLTGNHLTSISNRLGGVRRGFAKSGISSGDTADGAGVWIQALGNNMEQKFRKGVDGFESNAFSTTIGIDYLVGRNTRLGLAGGYGYADVKSKGSGNASDDIHSYNVSMYGSYDTADLREERTGGKNHRNAIKKHGEDYWHVDGVLGFAWNEYDSRREINLGSTKRTAKAEHSGQAWSAKTEFGYMFTFESTKSLQITPFAGLEYSCLRMNGYKENGAGALNLNVKGKSYHEIEQTLGVRGQYPIETDIGTVIPAVKAAWLYDYIGDRYETRASFAGGGQSFVSRGAKPAKSGVLIGAEAALLTKGNWTFTGNWDLEKRDKFLSNTYYATARLDF